MSIRAYRLLRNNKEEGPFTAEEMIQKNLKPYDLVWVDGRSAAWRYPGEMPEFKMHVPLPGDQNENNYANKKQSSYAVSPSVQAAVAINDNIPQPAIKQPKPRYKVSAAWNRIQTITTPSAGNVMVAEPQKISASINEKLQAASAQSKSLSWEEAWFDWEKEKFEKPVTEVVKVKANPTQTKSINQNYVAPVLETKYAEPLDTLKDKYIDNILQQKKRSRSFSFGRASEFALPSIALIIIFSVGYWLLHGSSETAAALSSSPTKTVQAKIENTNTLPANTPVNTENNTAANSENNIADNSTIKDDNTSMQNTVPSTKQAVMEEAEERKPAHVYTTKTQATKKADAIKPVNSNTSNQITGKQKITNKQFDPSVINNVPADNSYNDASSVAAGDLNAAENRPVRRRTNADNSTSNQSSQNNTVTATKKASIKSSGDYVNVPQYIEMNNGSADLKIQNVSDVDLDLVVVDVQYYDASSRFRKGETLYLHNLRAGKNVVVKTPKDLNSQYATSKVSLVSSDANKVYLIGDN